MSNDLIFSILPRNTKVPIETDNRVKKVARSEKSEALNQDEKEQHDEVHSQYHYKLLNMCLN